jgi:hypothetical protein
MSTHPLGALMIQVAREDGWTVSNVGEAMVAHELGLLGYTPRDIECQFKLGPYHLDFAIPGERIDIEADGWVHTARDVRRRDAFRDRRLREWGWVVVRVDIERPDAGEQLRRHVPDRSRIKDYGSTLRQAWFIFVAYLDQLQRRGVSDPAEQLDHLRDALQEARRSMMPPRRQQVS